MAALEFHTEEVKFFLIVGIILLAVGLGTFGAMSQGLLPPAESPVSPPFLVGFMTSVGGVAFCAFYLALKLWNRLYKRPS